MKILMLVPFLPNTSMSGGQTRWYNIIKGLSKEHDITLFSLIKDESEKQFIPELQKYCKKVEVFSRPKSPWTLRNLLFTAFSYYPLLVVRNYSPKEKRAVLQELKREKYDLIHAETFYVMPHVPQNTQVPSVLVEQTIEYLVYKHYVDHEVPWLLRPIYLIDVIKLRFWELYFWRKTNRLVAVSEDDKRVMQQLIPNINVDVIPNGVDTNAFANHKMKRKTPPRLLYGAANFNWLQNVEAVKILLTEVWPHIYKKAKNVHLWIVGRNIPQSIYELAKAHPRVEFTESIADVRDALKAASIMIVPVEGPGGTRLKVLEAMASRLPVVSTETGVAGLKVTDGEHAVVGKTPKDLADGALKLLSSPVRQKAVGEAGHLFVKKYFDWSIIVGLHEKIYNEITGKIKKTR